MQGKMETLSTSEQDFLKRLTEIIDANLHNEQFGVKDLIHEMGMSRSSFHRRITQAAKMPANQFICQVRLKKALKMLTETSLTVSETAYECGFHSVPYFSKCFRNYYGYSPGKAGNRNETELPSETNNRQKTGKWKKWLIPVSSLIIFGLILFIISESVYYGSDHSGKKESTNTIAILPLKFDGSDSMRIMAGGLTEAVLNRLMEIENLVIRSKTSVEQYRETTKPLKEIAKEMKVDYVIETSGWQYGDNLQFQINLADAENDNYLLREPYTANLKEENFLDLQNLIVFDIIEKTKTQLSPHEKEKLKMRLTDNPAALNEYLQGLKYLDLSGQKGSFGLWQQAAEVTLKAKMNFEKAIQLDSGFIEAYLMLGQIYINKLGYNVSQRKEYLDSGLVMAEKAISLHNNRIKGEEYHQALSLKSTYMRRQGKIEESKKLFKEALKYGSVNTPENYKGMFSTYSDFEDYYETINAFYKYVELKPEEELIAPWMYNQFCLVLFNAGFPNVAEKYLLECLNTNLDSANFYHYMCLGNIYSGNFESSITYANKGMKVNPNSNHMFLLCNKTISYLLLREFESALKTLNEINNQNWLNFPENYFKSLAALVYLRNGQPTRANQYFQEAITNLNNEISTGHRDASLFYSHFELAMIYAALDDKERALHYLNEVTNKPKIPRWIIICLENHTAVDNIRHDHEFIKLERELTDKYQKEHKRMATLLRQNGEI
jgi:AraC-like DNA-binding protein/TolB-like protein/Tfp pilus assembly protein PilF